MLLLGCVVGLLWCRADVDLVFFVLCCCVVVLFCCCVVLCCWVAVGVVRLLSCFADV